MDRSFSASHDFVAMASFTNGKEKQSQNNECLR